MLPPEIDPFANLHKERLDIVRERLAQARDGEGEPLTQQELATFARWLNHAISGFERFRICMADEVKQKERYSKYAKANGYPFS